MSNKTLLEINHDFAIDIERNKEAFVNDLMAFLRNPTGPRKEQMEREWHIRVCGTWGDETAYTDLLTVCQDFLGSIGKSGYFPVPGATATGRMRRAVEKALYGRFF